MKDLSWWYHPTCACFSPCTNNTYRIPCSYIKHKDSELVPDNPASLPPSHLSRDQVCSRICSFLCCFFYWCFHSTIKWSSNIWWTSMCKGKTGNQKSKGSVEGDTYIRGKQTINRSIEAQCKTQELEQDSPFRWPEEWHRGTEGKFTAAQKRKGSWEISIHEK